MRDPGNLSEGLYIVVSAFNEGVVIGSVVSQLRAQYPRVVVVDDCSRDNTAPEALHAGAVVLRHKVNLGAGAAIQTGIAFAMARGAEWIVTFDGDGQHRVEDIAVLLERQRRTGADVVLGNRFLGSTSNMPMRRTFLLKMAVLFNRVTTGVPLTDAHNGLRLLTRNAASKIGIRQNRMAHASEIVSRSRQLGLRIVEAPVTILYTDYSLRKGQTFGDAVNIVAELIIARLGG